MKYYLLHKTIENRDSEICYPFHEKMELMTTNISAICDLSATKFQSLTSITLFASNLLSNEPLNECFELSLLITNNYRESTRRDFA